MSGALSAQPGKPSAAVSEVKSDSAERNGDVTKVSSLNCDVYKFYAIETSNLTRPHFIGKMWVGNWERAWQDLR